MSASQFVGGNTAGAKNPAAANLASRVGGAGAYGMPGGLGLYGNTATSPYAGAGYGNLYPGRYPTLNSPLWGNLPYGNNQPFLPNAGLAQASRMAAAPPPPPVPPPPMPSTRCFLVPLRPSPKAWWAMRSETIISRFK